MQPPDLLRVSRGLALVHWGFRLIAAGVILTAVIFAVNTGLRFFHRQAPFDLQDLLHSTYLYCNFFWGLGFLIVPPIVIGILVGSIGRVLCLRTPPELPIARARIRLAVLLEGCGLMTAAVNGGVIAATILANSNNIPYEVRYAVLWFAVVLFVAGRAFFYAFSVALAKAVDMKLVHRSSVAALVVIVTGSMVSFAGLLLLGGTRTLTEVLTAWGAFVVALCVFGILYVYGRHLGRLRAEVKQFNARAAGETA